MSDNEPKRLYDTTRRTFLTGTAAFGVAGVAASIGAVTAQATTFRLGGESSGWMGRAPSAIEGTTNPTLQLEAGTDYTIEWENVDGQPHNVVIGDGDGNNLVRSDVISEQGATQTVEFTAEEAMATYYCEVHPSSMRGDIQMGTGTGTGTETGTATDGEETRLIPQGASIGLQEVAAGPIQQPIGFTYAEEDEDRRFITDQNGYIYVHTADGLQEEPFLDIHEDLYYLTETAGNFPRPEEGTFDERGLLGLAFHPEFADNGKFYVRYSAPPKENIEDYVGPTGRSFPDAVDHTFTLSEFTVNDDGSAADPESERVLLEIPEPQFNHNAGVIEFGPDGYLYVTVGDGGGANDDFVGHVDDWYDQNAGGNGQDLTQNLMGSILRIDVDNEGEETPYAVPEDNPLVGEDGFDEQYAWGFRNPWKMSFNDGDLYVGDVGQSLYEEVSIVEKGGNYGWNVKEGTHCFSTENPTQPPANCPDSTPNDVRGGEPLIDPVIQYPHTYQGTSVGVAVTGGYVYQGDAISELEGEYVFGDWSRSFTQPQGRLFIASPNSDGGETGTSTPMGTADGGTPTTTTESNTSTATTTAAGETGTPTSGGSSGEDVLGNIRELVVDGGENGEMNRFVLGFGRDQDGEVYVLGTTTGGVKGDGAVYKIVPAGEGEEISAPAGQPTGTPTTATESGEMGTETGTAGGETGTGTATGNETGTGVETETETVAGGEGTGAGTPADGDGTETGTAQPGFGFIATLGGIGSAAAYLLYRNDEEKEE